MNHLKSLIFSLTACCLTGFSAAQEIVPLDVEPAPMQEAEPTVPSTPVMEMAPSKPAGYIQPVVDMPASRHIPDSGREFYDQWIKNKLEVGTRIINHSFDETTQGKDTPTFADNYFGSINELDPDDDSSPTRFFLQYAITEYFGVGLSIDNFSLATKDGPAADQTDGDVEVDSTYWYLFARYPNEYNVVPFAELGYGFHSVDFSPVANWSARGNSLILGDDSGVYYAVGVEYCFSMNWSVNALYRVSSVSTTGEYRVNDGRAPVPVSMNLDHSSLGFGVKYTF